MMNRRKYQIPAIFLAMSLLLSACGGKENAAATMHLFKTEGTVQVNDAKGKSVEIMENLGLYSGYGVSTQESSYGWINLDDAKLAKLDEGSEAEVRKDGKLLELHVQQGSLFFNVAKPLEEDESMDIRTSTMMVGIRGTCGWVEVEDENLMRVYLLRGKVVCSILDKKGGTLVSQELAAGETATMTLDEKEASITIAAFDAGGIPDFVTEEIEGDASLAELLHPEPAETDTPPEEGDVPESEAEDSLLAAYAGSYAPYPSFNYYSGGNPITLDENGVVTGGETDGRSPSSVTQNADGSIAIIFNEGERYTVYPPGVAVPSHWGNENHREAVNIENLYTAGGAMNIVYHADPASLGSAGN